MPQGKKVAKGKASKSSSEQHSSEQENDHVQEVEQTSQDAPVVKDWADDSKSDDGHQNETKQNQTILDFNRDDVADFENKTVSELSITQLLQVLVRRGEVQENITVRKECGILMKKLHGEPLRKNPHRFNNRRDFVPRQQFVHVNGQTDQQNEGDKEDGADHGIREDRHGGYGGGGFRGRGDGGFRGRGDGGFRGRGDGGFRGRGGFRSRRDDDAGGDGDEDGGFRGRGTYGSRGGRGDYYGRDDGNRRGGYNPRFRRNFQDGEQPAIQQTQ